MPAIVVRTDPFASQQLERPASRPDLSQGMAEITRLIQEAGLVGLGGAAFPTHVKLQVPEGKHARFVIINGCECEPFLTCDHRLMLERAPVVIAGTKIVMKLVGAERGYVGVEQNKPDAIEALRRATAGDSSIEVVPLEVKYPQGAEKMLIDAILHRELPAGKLPIDLEVVVHNVGTTAALVDLIESGLPLIERIITVTGSGVRRPANLLVPVGTSLREVLDYCSGLHPETRQVILGGPMMGMAQKSLDVPIIKGVSGVVALTEPASFIEEDPCIRCGRCLEACPMFLNPSRLSLLSRRDDPAALVEHNVMDCCECASCSFVCPSHIPLVQLIRVGKATVRQRKKTA